MDNVLSLIEKRIDNLPEEMKADPLFGLYCFVFGNYAKRIPGATEKEKAVVYETLSLVREFYNHNINLKD